MSKKITRDEVATNKTEDSLWCIIDSKVYDLTEFADAHPGGSGVLLQAAGTDATAAFYNLHRHEVLQKYESLQIGTVTGETPQVVDPQPGDLSAVPYGEPAWLSAEQRSPYYKESHRRLRKALREWVERRLRPEAEACELSGERISDDLIREMAESNILAMRMGRGEHLKGRTLLGGVVKAEEFDAFHELVITQEMSRVMARGFHDGNMAGMLIGLPAVINFANDQKVKKEVVDGVLSGNRRICLAISEAFAGSDVAGMKTTAVKSADGSHYIVNGTKKWITNGTWCDLFVTGVKTPGGFSVLLIDRAFGGVETKPIKTSYSATAGTSFVSFDNVKVPANYLLHKEDQGFYVIMSNFNHERWGMAATTVRHLRIITEECLKWSHQRLVFGKRLVDQPVIRQKLAGMISRCEATQSWLEHITYQMSLLPYAQQSKVLGGPIGLFKSYATRCAHDVADEAVQIFGGRALTQTGMGRYVEMFNRTYKFDAILGGSEEILADMGVRQAMKFMPKAML